VPSSTEDEAIDLIVCVAGDRLRSSRRGYIVAGDERTPTAEAGDVVCTHDRVRLDQESLH
jgi:hypothetical protein